MGRLQNPLTGISRDATHFTPVQYLGNRTAGNPCPCRDITAVCTPGAMTIISSHGRITCTTGRSDETRKGCFLKYTGQSGFVKEEKRVSGLWAEDAPAHPYEMVVENTIKAVDYSIV
jgi:hypothetical protein